MYQQLVLGLSFQSLFVEASRDLFRATAYNDDFSELPEGFTAGKHFSQIRVLVPKSWPRLDQCSNAVNGRICFYLFFLFSFFLFFSFFFYILFLVFGPR